MGIFHRALRYVQDVVSIRPRPSRPTDPTDLIRQGAIIGLNLGVCTVGLILYPVVVVVLMTMTILAVVGAALALPGAGAWWAIRRLRGGAP